MKPRVEEKVEEDEAEILEDDILDPVVNSFSERAVINIKMPINSPIETAKKFIKAFQTGSPTGSPTQKFTRLDDMDIKQFMSNQMDLMGTDLIVNGAKALATGDPY